MQFTDKNLPISGMTQVLKLQCFKNASQGLIQNLKRGALCGKRKQVMQG